MQRLKDHLDPMVNNHLFGTFIADWLLLVPIFILFFFIILALKKMVVNHIDKTFVTSDAATILK